MTQPTEEHVNVTVGGAHGAFPSSPSPSPSQFHIGIRQLVSQPETYLNKKILIIGKRATGKTQMIIHEIYHQLKDVVDHVIVFKNIDGVSPTDPDEYICITHADQIYTPHDLSKVIQQIDKSLRNLIIFDNCGYDHNLMSSTHMRNLLFNLRWYNATLVVADQSPYSMPPEVRDQFDCVMLINSPLNDYLTKLYQCYGGLFQTHIMFREVIRKFKFKDRKFLYINLSSESDHLEDNIAWIKADITTPVQPPKRIPPKEPTLPLTDQLGLSTPTRAQLSHMIDELIRIRNTL